MLELLKEFLLQKSAFTRMSRGLLFAGAAFLATPDGQAFLGPHAAMVPAVMAALGGLMAVGEKKDTEDE